MNFFKLLLVVSLLGVTSCTDFTDEVELLKTTKDEKLEANSTEAYESDDTKVNKGKKE